MIYYVQTAWLIFYIRTTHKRAYAKHILNPSYVWGKNMRCKIKQYRHARKGEPMASNSSTVSTGKQSSKSGRIHNTVVYVKQHWELYVIFLLPALALTLIFKYIPMGGILIAFQDYNPFKGILDSQWVGLQYFQRFLSSPDFLSYLANELLGNLLFSISIPQHLGCNLEKREQVRENGNQWWTSLD